MSDFVPYGRQDVDQADIDAARRLKRLRKRCVKGPALHMQLLYRTEPRHFTWLWPQPVSARETV